MVTIVDYAQRTNSEGENFFALIVESGLEVVKSQETGKNYFTKKRASVPCTFTEDECSSLLGEQMPGSVKRVECDPYEITDESTGEVIKLNHRWEYFQEGDTDQEVVRDQKVHQPVQEEKKQTVVQ